MARASVIATRAADDALRVLGAQIRFARHEKNWTAAELAARIGVSPRTITSIESGNPRASIGNVFNAAITVGVNLFSAEANELARLRRRGEQTLALIPSRVYHPRTKESPGDFDF